MKSIKFSFLISIFFIISCTHRKEPMNKERGIVLEKQYFPNKEEVASGIGFSSKGNMVNSIHSIKEDEKYIVIFKCEHNVVFSINNSILYGKLNKNDSVKIDYYDLINNEGEIQDFEFIDANAIK